MSSSCVECSHGGDRARGLCEQESNTLPVQIDPARPDIVPWHWMDGWMGGQTQIVFFFIFHFYQDYTENDRRMWLYDLAEAFVHGDVWPVRSSQTLTCGRQSMRSRQGWTCERRKHAFFFFFFKCFFYSWTLERELVMRGRNTPRI